MNRNINIDKGEVFVLKVNEQGDTLDIYIGDGDMPLRFANAFDELQKAEKKTKSKVNRIKAMDKGERHSQLLSKAEFEVAKLMSDQFVEGRRIINDLFNDETASDKLFGKANTLTMFHDFFQQFTPIMEEVAERQLNYIDSLKDKYDQDESNVLE